MTQSLSYELINSPEKAHHILNDLSQIDTEHLFCDTEFIRFKDSLPLLQLLQLTYPTKDHNPESKIYIFDCQNASIIEHLKQFFLNTKKTFVFHSVRQDLEGIYNAIGFLPHAFFDLQIAASFLGFGLSSGLSELSEHYLNIIIDKSLQHSHWNHRPLSKKQISYAAKDVYLIQHIFPKITDELHLLKRYEWCAEFHHEYEENFKKTLNPDTDSYPHIRLDFDQRQKFFDFKKCIKKISDNVSIPHTILASNEMIQSFIIDQKNLEHPFHQSWRKYVLNELIENFKF